MLSNQKLRANSPIAALMIAVLPALASGPELKEQDTKEAQIANKDQEVIVTSLAESLKPLPDHFNTGKGRFRFVALLSPT